MGTDNKFKADEFLIGVGLYYLMLYCLIFYPAFTLAYIVGQSVGGEAGCWGE